MRKEISGAVLGTRKTGGRKEEQRRRSRVGMDEEERKEVGRGEKNRHMRLVSRRSTHGRIKRSQRRERERGRKAGTEVNYRRVNREGEQRYTVPGLSRTKFQSITQRNREVRSKGKGVETFSTRKEGGRKEAWGTRRQPNRYETYREGSRRSRASVDRARYQATQEFSIYN